MPCMVPLPDGTIMIMNGALHGTAGFGLAEDPNLTALLYDPTESIGSRFTILNTTIVARMYHSEATLLPDGRVLISGSDPQTYWPNGTVRYPEEFRIEVEKKFDLKMSFLTVLVRSTSHPTSIKALRNPPLHFLLIPGLMEGLIPLRTLICLREAPSAFPLSQPPQAHMETQWVQEPSSLPSLAWEASAPSLHLPMPVSHRLAGTNSSFSMGQHRLIHGGCKSAETLVNLVTGPTFLDLRCPASSVSSILTVPFTSSFYC